MTSYQFEVAAKNATIKIMKDILDEDLLISDLDFVWFSHVLGFKKCLIWGPKLKHYYVEVTYNYDKHEMYIDLYNKEAEYTIAQDDLNFSTTPVVPKKIKNIDMGVL